MKYPFVLPCPICGETPKEYEWQEEQDEDISKATCPNCGVEFVYSSPCWHDEVWNRSIKEWYEKNIPPKACPFCGNKGGEADIYIFVSQGRDGYFVACEACQKRGPSAETIPAALVAWNNLPREPEGD